MFALIVGIIGSALTGLAVIYAIYWAWSESIRHGH